MVDNMKAWHFLNNERKLGYSDNHTIEVGQTYSCKFPYTYDGITYPKPTLCKAGMHASIKVIDALNYAPGSIITLVEVSGDVQIGEDKITGKHRKVIRIADATNVLFEFSCIVAENALDLVEKNGGKTDERSYAAIKARRDFQKKLITKDELSATGAAAWDASRAIAWIALKADVRNDEGGALRAATASAAASATRDNVVDTVGDAVRAAAWTVARTAAAPAARDAWRDVQNKILEGMLMELINE